VERKNWRCLHPSPSIRKRLGRSAYLTKNSEKKGDVYFLIKYSGLYSWREKIGDVCFSHQVFGKDWGGLLTLPRTLKRIGMSTSWSSTLACTVGEKRLEMSAYLTKYSEEWRFTTAVRTTYEHVNTRVHLKAHILYQHITIRSYKRYMLKPGMKTVSWGVFIMGSGIVQWQLLNTH